MTTGEKAPLIRRLTVERFRGIEKLVWHPEPGLNVLLGGGDVGKTTLLDAIALLLSPTNVTILTDADYWRREIANEFSIEAVMTLPASCGINQQAKNAWPWQWSGTEPIQPALDEEPPEGGAGDPVYRLRVRGTAEFDLVFEIVQPDDSVLHFSVAVRRNIGLVRLGGDDRNDRDLRLVQGSALERLLADKTLRARLGQSLAKGDVAAELKDPAKAALEELNGAFLAQGLPTGLSLGLTGGQGLSLNALIGLTATRDDVVLPLSSWGAGTRRLAALEIAAVHQGENPITLVDEVERGLEPYRQRVLLAELQEGDAQVFLTTHSAAALSATSGASLWYLDSKGTIGRVPSIVGAHLEREPETFLSRVAIVAEGPTEVGFVTSLLRRAIGGNLLSHGLWVANGGGNSGALTLLEGMTRSGLIFGGFADNEGTHPGRWAAVHAALGPLLFRWPLGCLEENIFALVPEDRIEDLIKDPEDELTGERLRTLADRIGSATKDLASVKANAPDFSRLLIEAATGAVPDDKKDADKSEKKALRKHAETWFKSLKGGEELAEKVFSLGLWPAVEPTLLPFLNAVRATLSLPPLTSLPQ